MLLELLPHITRLVPAADKYFSSRSASERAQEAALTAMADGVRGDLGKLTAAHADIYVALKEQSAQLEEQGVRLAEAAAEAKWARVLAESAEQRFANLEKRMTLGIRLVGAVLAMLVATLVLLGVVLVKMHH
jgi:hypothetical protein